MKSFSNCLVLQFQKEITNQLMTFLIKLLNQSRVHNKKKPSMVFNCYIIKIHHFHLGFCVKTKNVITSQKIFVNICHTTVIPSPVDITESELTRILDSDEPSTFRIPMSLGEGHEEVDKCNLIYRFFFLTKIVINEICFLHTAGQPCVAYDVAINSSFFAKVESSLLFQTFLITISMEGLEDKYKMELDKNGIQRRNLQ